MKLADYLLAKNMRPSQLAGQMGKPASTITRLLSRERRPSISLAQEIANVTGGAVMPNDFLDDGNEPPPQHRFPGSAGVDPDSREVA